MGSSLKEDELSFTEINELGTFNAEEARGILHTSDWRARMAALQERFDRQMANAARIQVKSW